MSAVPAGASAVEGDAGVVAPVIAFFCFGPIVCLAALVATALSAAAAFTIGDADGRLQYGEGGVVALTATVSAELLGTEIGATVLCLSA